MGLLSPRGSQITTTPVAGSHLGRDTLLPTLMLFFLASDRDFQFGNGSTHQLTTSNATNLPGDGSDDEKEEAFRGLAELLPKVAMDDGTVIITTVNEAWARLGSLLDLFLGSFRDGEGIAHLLNHTHIVAADPGAMALCQAVHPHCYLHEVTSANVSSANRFMTKSYLELIWARLEVPQRILQLGYNYLSTDVDVMWLRNPFRHISLYADVAMSTDRFYGNAEDLQNVGNGGFYYIRSTNRTVEMLSRWLAARSRFPSAHDQGVLNEIKAELAAGDLQIKFVFLDIVIFGGFCQFHEEMDKVSTMHANCCIELENKVDDLGRTTRARHHRTSSSGRSPPSARRRWENANY
uniref:Nucleotide-diphospho-sugar transferase domain-containing protein n=1 Tax=Aegilops tauschii TaxID=37682 RepID=M8BAS4_AEGTA